MSFHFALETVLHYRKTVERAEEITLHRIAQEIADVQLEIRQIETSQHSLRELRDRDLIRGLPAAHLQELDEQEVRLTRGVNRLRVRLQQLEISRQKQLAVFQSARRDREVLSKIREERHKSYQREQLRQEQKTLDDLFLAQMMNAKE